MSLEFFERYLVLKGEAFNKSECLKTSHTETSH